MKKSIIALIMLILMGTSINSIAYEPQTKVSGYMDTEWISEGDVNTFRAHRFIVNYGSIISPKVRLNSEIEYEYGGYVTNKDDADNNQEGQIKIEQAWVDYDMSDLFTFRSGIVLVPVGQLNIYHDSDMRDFTARPLVNYYIIPTTWMDTGVGLHGSIEHGDFEYTYEGYVINGLDSENSYSTTKGLRNMRPNFKNDTNKGKAITGRLGVIPNINTNFGFSSYQGQGGQSLFALDGRYSVGQLSLKSEVATYTDDFDNNANGFNLEGKYNISPFFNLKEEINLIARVEQVDLVASNSDEGQINRTSIGFNFKPVPSLLYKVEYSFNESQDSTDDDNTLMASVAVGF